MIEIMVSLICAFVFWCFLFLYFIHERLVEIRDLLKKIAKDEPQRGLLENGEFAFWVTKKEGELGF